MILYTSLIQVHCPLVFCSFLGEHLRLLVSILEINSRFKDSIGDNDVCKAALLSLIRILRLHTYYADEEMLSKTIVGRMLNETLVPLRSECRRQFMGFFTPQVIESLMSLIVTQVLGCKAAESE